MRTEAVFQQAAASHIFFLRNQSTALEIQISAARPTRHDATCTAAAASAASPPHPPPLPPRTVLFLSLHRPPPAPPITCAHLSASAIAPAASAHSAVPVGTPHRPRRFTACLCEQHHRAAAPPLCCPYRDGSADPTTVASTLLQLRRSPRRYCRCTTRPREYQHHAAATATTALQSPTLSLLHDRLRHP